VAVAHGDILIESIKSISTREFQLFYQSRLFKLNKRDCGPVLKMLLLLGCWLNLKRNQQDQSLQKNSN
jgi:hypothetical protein